LNTMELGVSVRLTLRAYLRAKSQSYSLTPASLSSVGVGFTDFLPLLHRLLHEHRLLRPRLDELIRDPVFRERRAWLAARLLEQEQGQGQGRGGSPQRHHQLSLLLRQGRRDQLEDVGSRYKGRSLLLYHKRRAPGSSSSSASDGSSSSSSSSSKGSSNHNSVLRATFSFEDLRDDLQRSFHAKQHRAAVAAAVAAEGAGVGSGGAPAMMITLVVSASRNDWKVVGALEKRREEKRREEKRRERARLSLVIQALLFHSFIHSFIHSPTHPSTRPQTTNTQTINNREASTCSAILEMETRPLSPTSPTSPSAPSTATGQWPFAANAAAHFRQQQQQQQQRHGSSFSLRRMGSEGSAAVPWGSIVNFDHVFRPVSHPRSGSRNRNHDHDRHHSSHGQQQGQGRGLPPGHGHGHGHGRLQRQERTLLELERVDGRPLRTVDRLFLVRLSVPVRDNTTHILNQN
jgi:hypothetical protein